MKNYFSQKDIQEFLAQSDFGLWTMNIFDKKTNKLRQAKASDFEDEIIQTYEILDSSDDKTLKDFAISNFRFAEIGYSSSKKQNVDERTSTINWCCFLVEKYGEEYAKEVQNWCDENIKSIDDILTKNDKTLSVIQKGMFSRARSLYVKLIESTKRKLKEIKNTKQLYA